MPSGFRHMLLSRFSTHHNSIPNGKKGESEDRNGFPFIFRNFTYMDSATPAHSLIFWGSIWWDLKPSVSSNTAAIY